MENHLRDEHRRRRGIRIWFMEVEAGPAQVEVKTNLASLDLWQRPLVPSFLQYITGRWLH